MVQITRKAAPATVFRVAVIFPGEASSLDKIQPSFSKRRHGVYVFEVSTIVLVVNNLTIKNLRSLLWWCLICVHKTSDKFSSSAQISQF